MAGARGRGDGQGRGRGRPRKIPIDNFEITAGNNEDSKEDEIRTAHANKGSTAKSQVEASAGNHESPSSPDAALKDRNLGGKATKVIEINIQPQANGTVTLAEENKEGPRVEEKSAWTSLFTKNRAT